MDPKAFGRWVRDNRRRIGLTQEELADKVGCAASYLSTLENGRPHSKSGGIIQPGKDLVQKMALVFGVTVDEGWLLADYAPANESGLSEYAKRRLERIFAKIPDPHRQESVLDALETLVGAA